MIGKPIHQEMTDGEFQNCITEILITFVMIGRRKALLVSIGLVHKSPFQMASPLKLITD